MAINEHVFLFTFFGTASLSHWEEHPLFRTLQPPLPCLVSHVLIFSCPWVYSGLFVPLIFCDMHGKYMHFYYNKSIKLLPQFLPVFLKSDSLSTCRMPFSTQILNLSPNWLITLLPLNICFPKCCVTELPVWSHHCCVCLPPPVLTTSVPHAAWVGPGVLAW